MPDQKYVHVEGRVQITYQKGVPSFPGIPAEPGEDVLVLQFLNEAFELRTDVDPLYFYLTDKGNEDPVKFRNVHLIARFNETGFKRAERTLRIIDPTLEPWEEIEPVTKDDPGMNPSGPPK